MFAFLFALISQDAPAADFYPRVSHVYAPTGFDSNDPVVEVVLDGYLPNHCYRMTGIEKEIDLKTNIIRVRPVAQKFTDICMDLIKPYLRSIELGKLPEGTYSVYVMGDDETEDPRTTLPVGTPKVIHMTNQTDDFLYAQVDSALILPADHRDEKKLDADLPRQILVVGSFPNKCYKFSELPVTYIAEGEEKILPVLQKTRKDVIEVLPVIEKINERNLEKCTPEDTPFRYTYNIPDSITGGKYLLYVRTMENTSFYKKIVVAKSAQEIKAEKEARKK